METYINKLEELLEDTRQAEAVHDQHMQIQNAIAEAALHAFAPCAGQEPETKASQTLLQDLIDERKALPGSETTRRCQISKRIKVQLRHIKHEERTEKIDTILQNL